MNVKRIRLSLLGLFISTVSLAQQEPPKPYVVLLFEDYYSYGYHGKQYFFWLVTGKSDSLEFSKIFSQITDYDLNNCLEGKATNPLMKLKESTSMPTGYHAKIKSLQNLLLKKRHRKKISTILVRNEKGLHRTKIFAATVVGDFCVCNFLRPMPPAADYTGHVALINSFFSKSKSSSVAAIWDRLHSYDFSKFDFTVLAY